ncbi:MAG: hypothetical protein Q8R76_08670 [Candidatus Omnitrophota bacterium]|nr:hypothetical protein [Candidatus Omnitrophota bacterium]
MFNNEPPHLRPYYRTLGIRPNATPEKVKEAYAERAWNTNPRRFAYDKRLERRAKEMMTDLDTAYMVVMISLGQRQGGRQLLLDLRQ